MIAFWLLFTRRVHTVFASTGLTNVYRQKLTGNLFGRIVDGNYYFIDGHARATDLLYSPLSPSYYLLARVPFCAYAPNALLSKELRYAVLCIKINRDIADAFNCVSRIAAGLIRLWNKKLKLHISDTGISN